MVVPALSSYPRLPWSFREFRTPEAQFPRRPPLGSSVNMGNTFLILARKSVYRSLVGRHTSPGCVTQGQASTTLM
jgi:hypothetical protein